MSLPQTVSSHAGMANSVTLLHDYWEVFSSQEPEDSCEGKQEQCFEFAPRIPLSYRTIERRKAAPLFSLIWIMVGQESKRQGDLVGSFPARKWACHTLVLFLLALRKGIVWKGKELPAKDCWYRTLHQVTVQLLLPVLVRKVWKFTTSAFQPTTILRPPKPLPSKKCLSHRRERINLSGSGEDIERKLFICLKLKKRVFTFQLSFT